MPRHQPAAGGALQLAGKGKGLLGRDQPHLFDGLTAAAKELDLTGSGAVLLNAGRIAVNHKQADFTDGALRQPLLVRAAGACCGGVSQRLASQRPLALLKDPCCTITSIRRNVPQGTWQQAPVHARLIPSLV